MQKPYLGFVPPSLVAKGSFKQYTGPLSCHSNMYPARIVGIGGMTFQSSENAYQAMKFAKDMTISVPTDKYPEVVNARAYFATLKPHESKERAKAYQKQQAGLTDDLKLKIMRSILIKKYQHRDLAVKLVLTPPEALVEFNYWHDNFWGVCTCKKCDYKGLNHLGLIQQQVRQELIGDFPVQDTFFMVNNGQEYDDETEWGPFSSLAKAEEYIARESSDSHIRDYVVAPVKLNADLPDGVWAVAVNIESGEEAPSLRFHWKGGHIKKSALSGAKAGGGHIYGNGQTYREALDDAREQALKLKEEREAIKQAKKRASEPAQEDGTPYGLSSTSSSAFDRARKAQEDCPF